MWILDAFTARAAYKSVFTRNHTQLLIAMVREGLKQISGRCGFVLSEKNITKVFTAIRLRHDE